MKTVEQGTHKALTSAVVPSTTKQYSAQQAFVSAIRAIANFYEQHPELPLPLSPDFTVFVHDTESRTAKAIFADFARAAKPVTKKADTIFYDLVRDFGGVKLTFCSRRENVCTRRVIDVRHVAEEVIPEHTVPAEVRPAHDEEVVVWDCPESLLTAKETEVA